MLRVRGGTLRVGLVFDVGGRGDKSFNDGAYEGALRAARELGAAVRFIEPGAGSDRETGLRLLAAQGMDLVIGFGFIFQRPPLAPRARVPDVALPGVDYAVQTDSAGRPLPLPPNLAALKFREEEGSFLVGALAGLLSKTRALGFVGGMNIPFIHKFAAGYREGVPTGRGPDGLPTSLALCAAHDAEGLLLSVAQRYQEATGHHREVPPRFR
jgi:basic membrane protein A